MPVAGSPAGPDAEVPFELSPTPPIEPGGIVGGKYRIDRVIGFGGMGIVCAATHLELGTPIAVKFVRSERGSDDRAVARFLTEARAAAQLNSQFACRVMDCGRLPTGTPYLVMEHLVGSDLRTLVGTRGPLAIEEAVSFALQACEALAEAHSKHIVHRDIKPENLFVTQGPDGTPLLKVLDFGISKQLGPLDAKRALTEPTESMGSPFHMSPEQMIDPAGVDSRTDIWSLGVVLYELLTGQLPFTGESTPQLCANVMTTQPIPPSMHRAEIPDDLSQVILRCLEKDRERRFGDVAELSASLKEFGGASAYLAAARVERILGRTGLGSVPGVLALQVQSEAPVSGSDEPAASIPGVPRRGLLLRVSVGLVLVAASGLAAYALRRAWLPAEPHSAELASETLTAHRAEAPLPSGSAFGVPVAPSAEFAPRAAPSRPPRSVVPSRSKSARASRPKAPTVARPRPVRAAPTDTVEAPRDVPSTPADPPSGGPTLYPELAPVPDMEPPE